MFTSTAQQEFKQTLKEFTAKEEAKYSYAYSAGYLESLCVEMFGSLTKKEQKYFQQNMQKAVDDRRV
jgi:hypothetical protein